MITPPATLTRQDIIRIGEACRTIGDLVGIHPEQICMHAMTLAGKRPIPGDYHRAEAYLRGEWTRRTTVVDEYLRLSDAGRAEFADWLEKRVENEGVNAARSA